MIAIFLASFFLASSAVLGTLEILGFFPELHYQIGVYVFTALAGAVIALCCVPSSNSTSSKGDDE